MSRIKPYVPKTQEALGESPVHTDGDSAPDSATHDCSITEVSRAPVVPFTIWRTSDFMKYKIAELPQNLPRRQFLFKDGKLVPVKNSPSVINEVTLPDGTVLEIEAPADRPLKANEIRAYIMKQEQARVENSSNPLDKFDSHSDAELEAVAQGKAKDALLFEQIRKAYDPATYRNPPASPK